MDYTIDDLRGRYVRVGTPEAEIFLDACEELGIRWHEGEPPREYSPNRTHIALKLNSVPICNSDEHAYLELGYTPFTPKPQWSIYSNNKTLCDLSDEQAAALFNAWRGGCNIQVLTDDEWEDYNSRFHPLDIYRIKQKSERELFIEKCVELTHDGINKHLFEVLFNAGCRFTKD